MDFNKLRASALNHGEDEEAVTVNTRALIDKVLARYSGEWTTLRELIQNAADAQASTVRIKFETLPSTSIPLPNTTNKSELLKHTLLHHTLRSLVVSNDGQPFGVSDWSRLKRIAEGNPDETKIGAFGVGFYSVFADCEDPFVSSGSQAMAFFWKGNSLFTRRLQLPHDQANPETSFVLDYRNTTTPMPNLLSIAQFLATSLTFVSLRGIELWVDEYRIVSLKKKSAPSVALPIGRDVDTKTKEGLMKVQGLEKESVQMDAEFMNVVGWKPTLSSSVSKPSQDGYSSGEVPSLRSFFSRLTSAATKSSAEAKAQREENAFQEIVLEDLTKLTTANVFLRVTTATVKTSVSSSFAAELERATKKPPPKVTRLATLTASYDETAASSQENAVATKVDIFASVLPGKKPGGRIFIGFPTHQTTGAGMHLSAPSVIPTVERESIDLNARWVRTWNVEMLRVAGIIARLAFANEMGELSQKIKRACETAGHPNKITKAEIAQFMPEALHIIRTFSFVESTPSSKVSEIIEEAFWTTYKHPYIDIYSSQGVLPTSKVRLATEDLSGFVEGIPVVPDELVRGAFVNKLRDFGIITEITFEDVKAELGAKALTQKQLIQFISWAGRKALSGQLTAGNVASLMSVAVATTGDEEGHGEILTLGTIQNYLNANKIPADARIPPSTIPFLFTKSLNDHELSALGWEPLEIVPWLRYLIESNGNAPPEQDFAKSHDYAVRILQILSKSWDGLSQNSKGTVVSLLSPIPIVPTKSGMKRPGEAFFESVKLFDDLPTITRCQGVKEKFFVAIGVRKTVDLETIFSRLLSPTDAKRDVNNSGRHMQLIQYLASVSGDIPAEDLKRLKSTPICPAEDGPPGSESSKGTSKLYKVSELFEPRDQLRNLGLPILQWPGPPGSYRAGAPEGRFLSRLGIRAHPSVPELIDMMCSEDPSLRRKAMDYFVANHYSNNYAAFDITTTNRRFLPIRNDDKLVAPSECFTNEHCAILGFSILGKDLQAHAAKFGVAMDPPIAECVLRLLNKPPPNYKEAITMFNYFAGRLNDLAPAQAIKLGQSKIVPVALKEGETAFFSEKGSVKYLTPFQCYLGNSSKYGEIFDFVDFGDLANAFLLKCGAKHEPTSIELAALASREPARLLGIMKSPDKYLSLLKTLAEDMAVLKRDRELWKQLKLAKWLLGSKDIPNTKSQKHQDKSLLDGSGSEDEDEPSSIKQYELAAPRQIVIVDDYNAYRLFKSSLICAPQDDVTEDFYLALGAVTLGSLVEEQLRLGPIVDRESTSAKLRAHVLERSKIFLYEYQNRPKEIRHDARWMERNLKMQVVASISLRRSLRGHSLGHTEKRSAAYQADRMKGYTLYVTADNPDTYQLSQALCSLMLERPSQSSYVLFESFLSLSLYQLRSRGYNVDRILRAKAAEARLAEEQQKKLFEREQEQLREIENMRKAQEQQAPVQAKEQSVPSNPTLPPLPAPERPQSRDRKSLDMPGAFGSDPPEPPADQNPNNGVRDLFSRFTRRFNNSSRDSSRNPFALEGSSEDERPPPYSDSPTTAPKNGEERVSSPASIQASLQSGISASRAHSSSTLQSKQHQDPTNTVKEASSFCNPAVVHNLVSVGSSAGGMRVFVDKSLSAGAQGWLASNKQSLDTFESVLRDAAEIFGVPAKAVHIFFDVAGSTIAFNQGGSLWANFRYWQQLHEARCLGRDASKRVEPLSYWWVTLAHELAHNLHDDHDAEHGFYTQSYISEYFPAALAKASSYMSTST